MVQVTECGLERDSGDPQDHCPSPLLTEGLRGHRVSQQQPSLEASRLIYQFNNFNRCHLFT